MSRHGFVFILIFSIMLSSCIYERTSAYLRKDTIEKRIEQSPTPIIVVPTLPSQLCLDKPVETNYSISKNCSQYSAVDWHPIDLILSDNRTIVIIKDTKKITKIYDLYKYGEMNFNLLHRSNLQFARFKSLSEYQQFKRSHSFLEYQMTDFVDGIDGTAVLSCLTLFVFPGNRYELYDVNIIAYNPGQEQKRAKIYQTHRLQTISWLLFIWGMVISDPEYHFEHYTILSPAAQLIEQ